MSSVALAVVVGIAAFPLVLIFGPAYFPSSMLVLACLGGCVGLSIVARGARWRVLRALGVAVMMVAVVIAVGTVTANFALDPRMLVAAILWSAWLLPPISLGVVLGSWLRERVGIVRGAVIGSGIALAIALLGTGLAFLVAPVEVANAPTCDDGFECPRRQCAYMAERRRLLAIERVTAFDGERITCTYTGWGGLEIGRADMGRNGGSWTDGAWPLLISGRLR